MGETLTAEVVEGKVIWGKKEEPPKECKGKRAARSLARLVLDPKINQFLTDNDPFALEQAMQALEPFGYPDTATLKYKLGL